MTNCWREGKNVIKLVWRNKKKHKIVKVVRSIIYLMLSFERCAQGGHWIELNGIEDVVRNILVVIPFVNWNMPIGMRNSGLNSLYSIWNSNGTIRIWCWKKKFDIMGNLLSGRKFFKLWYKLYTTIWTNIRPIWMLMLMDVKVENMEDFLRYPQGRR